MPQGFPPDYGLIAAVSVRLLLLALVVGSLWQIGRSTRRPPQAANFWIWLVLGLLILNVPQVRVDPVSLLRLRLDRPELNVWVLALLLVCAVGAVSYLWRRSARWLSNGAKIVLLVGCGLCMLLRPGSSAREAALRTQCRNHLKQIGLALHNYADAYGSLPIGEYAAVRISWRVLSLPYLDGPKGYDPALPWDRDPNAALLQRPQSPYICPSDPLFKDQLGRHYTDYVRLHGDTAIFDPQQAQRFPRSVPDGLSNTLAVVEAAGLLIYWTEPRDFDISQQPIGVNLKGSGWYDSPGMISSYHTGIGNVLFADGSVRMLSENTDPRILRALATAEGGEPQP